MMRKMGRQAAKDYLFYPALSGRRFVRTFLVNLVAAGFRNGWAYIVIVCGHFVDGAEKFTPATVETKAEWYLRQMLGNREFQCGPGQTTTSWKPLLPDRAPPVPRPAEQQAPRDCGASSGDLGRVRPAVHATGPLIQASSGTRCAPSASCPSRIATSRRPPMMRRNTIASEEKFRSVAKRPRRFRNARRRYP